MKSNDKIFFSSLILTLIILSVIIYISSVQPSKEEFIEVHWQILRSGDLTGTDSVVCKIENCSKSGIYKIGNIDLDGMNFGLITIDSDKSNKYNYTCIDFNKNGIYCEEDEGPFKERDTFLINNNGFNFFSISDKNVVVAYYPKTVDQENFTVGFVLKSHYKRTLDIKTTMSVDNNEPQSKIQTLKADEEIISTFNVTLSTVGLHEVKISTTPTTIDMRNEIYFWIERI